MSTDTTQADDPLPVYYQRRDVDFVFKMIRSGESCSLIGIGSVGKSNLMHFLTLDDVKREYLQAAAQTTLMVLLDPHKIVRLEEQALRQAGSSWPGYEIMLSRLRRALIEHDDKGLLPKDANVAQDDDLVSRVEDYYLNLFDSQPLMAQTGIRQLEEAVYEVMRLGKGWKVVFLFDEFEAFSHLPADFFQSLRGLRDEFKQRVMYITASRKPLDEIATAALEGKGREAREAMEGFTELFHGFRRYIGLLERPSAEAIIRRLEKRYTALLDPTASRLLLDASGRHAGLLRRSFLPVASIASSSPTTDQLFDYLLKQPGVTQECQSIYESLTPQEQEMMRQLAGRQPVATNGDVWKSLSDKHLVSLAANGEPAMTLPLLGGWIKKHFSASVR